MRINFRKWPLPLHDAFAPLWRERLHDLNLGKFCIIALGLPGNKNFGKLEALIAHFIVAHGILVEFVRLCLTYPLFIVVMECLPWLNTRFEEPIKQTYIKKDWLQSNRSNHYMCCYKFKIKPEQLLCNILLISAVPQANPKFA